MPKEQKGDGIANGGGRLDTDLLTGVHPTRRNKPTRNQNINDATAYIKEAHLLIGEIEMSVLFRYVVNSHRDETKIEFRYKHKVLSKKMYAISGYVIMNLHATNAATTMTDRSWW